MGGERWAQGEDDVPPSRRGPRRSLTRRATHAGDRRRWEKRTITDEWESVFLSVEELDGILPKEFKFVGLFDHESGKPIEEPKNFSYMLMKKD